MNVSQDSQSNNVNAGKRDSVQAELESNDEQKKFELLQQEISEELEWETRNILFGYSPDWLQRFKSPEIILVLLCAASFAQGFIVNGLVNVVISTIERRYQMRSTQIGIIAGGYDIASLILLMPISYYGGTRRKPTFISAGVFVMGVGALVFSSPYFVSKKYEFSIESPRHCISGRNVTTCTANEKDAFILYKYLFFFGQFLHGAGAAPLWTLGCAYIDENVSAEMSSIYLGLFYTMAVIGPGVGYIIGGQFLQIYVDFLFVNEDQIGLTSSSDVWVGAWWFGFLLGAVFCFVVALPIAVLPKLLPGSKELRAKKAVEVHKTSLNSKAMEHGFGRTISDFPMSIWILASNLAFMFLSFAGATEGLLTSALAAFTPKIIEQQFHISPSTSALIVGLISIPSAAGGTFIGGCVVNKFELKVTSILKWVIVCTILSACTSVIFLVSCDTTQFAGITANYINEKPLNGFNLVAKCNSFCSCSIYEYDPVCGADNIVYFSPCYAGCYKTHNIKGSRVYSNCSCIGERKRSIFKTFTTNHNVSIEATRAKCPVNCNKLPVFLLFLFLSIFFTFLISMPSLTATMRCVVQNQKSFALGLQWIIVRVFGTIPAPFIFGKSIDLSCIYWKVSCESDSVGACILYNNAHLSISLTVLILSLKLLSLILFTCVLVFYKPTNSPQDNSGT